MKNNTEFSLLHKWHSRSNLFWYLNYRIERNIQHLQLRQPVNPKQSTMKIKHKIFKLKTIQLNNQNSNVTKTHSPIAAGSWERELWLRFNTARKGKFLRSSFNDAMLLWARISFWSSAACKFHFKFHSIFLIKSYSMLLWARISFTARKFHSISFHFPKRHISA